VSETTTDPAASASLAQRRCAYCGEEFSYQRGANRPPKYCSRIWPEPPRSCQARAKAQRTATKTVGLDLPLATYQQAGEQVGHAIATLRENLDGHLAALREVEQAALSRIEQAERDAREAWERTRDAEAERDQALQEKIQADARAEQAAAARLQAEQAARQAEQDRDTQVREAWEQVTAKEGERAAAETRAGQQAAAAAEAARLRQIEFERAEKTAADSRDLAGQLAAARAEASRQADAARIDLKAAHEQLARLHTEHATELTRMREQAASEAARLREERDHEKAMAEQLRAELATERATANRTAGELASVKTTLQAAERRYEQLLAALKTPEPDAHADNAEPAD
jgi:chromosome segregation ATPase